MSRHSCAWGDERPRSRRQCRLRPAREMAPTQLGSTASDLHNIGAVLTCRCPSLIFSVVDRHFLEDRFEEEDKGVYAASGNTLGGGGLVVRCGYLGNGSSTNLAIKYIHMPGQSLMMAELYCSIWAYTINDQRSTYDRACEKYTFKTAWAEIHFAQLTIQEYLPRHLHRSH